MTQATPLVSILLITMNHADFIAQACNSAIGQTWPNIEIIFLDNNSSDGTYEKGSTILQSSDVKFTLMRNRESFGVASNLNRMVAKASGDYVAILSGDDWWADNLIEEKMKFILENNCDFVMSDGYKFIQENGLTVPAYDEKEKQKIITSMTAFFHENVTGNKTVNVGTFISRKLLTDYPFDENINTEDWDMNLRMTNLGYKPGFLDKKLFYYRVLATSLSRKWKVMQDSYEKVTAKYLVYILNDPKLQKEYMLNKLHFKYEILLHQSQTETERKSLQREWKREKYRLKYRQPILFFKLLTV
ncbi:MAG: glycosyltransferase [Weeksellaceae bacterium]|nr:glycosyltransferase [Weeksellaceae bacterium]